MHPPFVVAQFFGMNVNAKFGALFAKQRSNPETRIGWVGVLHKIKTYSFYFEKISNNLQLIYR